MKPMNAKKIAVDSDLTEGSYSRARYEVVELASELGFHGENSDYKYFSGHYILRVPSQVIGDALMIRIHESFYIDMDFNYKPDEWSLHYRMYNDAKKEHDEAIIWSPGA